MNSNCFHPRKENARNLGHLDWGLMFLFTLPGVPGSQGSPSDTEEDMG